MMMDVFIVEDEEMIQELYKDILSMRGYNVAGVASTGEEAVEMFKAFEKKPDLIIMDHRMPGMGGLEAARVISDLDSSTKLILVSADDNAVWEALKMGIVGMKKPFNIGDMLSTIEASAPKTPSVPDIPEMKDEPTLTRSGLYLVQEEEGKRGIELFRELVEAGYNGLIFTRKHPDNIRSIKGLDEVPIAWFSSTPMKDVTCISPLNIQKMLIMVQSAMSQSDRTAVLVYGFEYILTNINFDRALNLLQVLNDRIMTSQNSMLIFSMDLDILGERDRKMISREFEKID